MKTLKTILLLLALSAGVISLVALSQLENKLNSQKLEINMLKKRIKLLDSFVKNQAVLNVTENLVTKRNYEKKLFKITDQLR